MSRLVREFVLDIRSAQNLLVIKTIVGSAQPVAAALDEADWTEVVGTIAGDDTILIVCPDKDDARKLAGADRGNAELDGAAKLKTAVLGATGYSGLELTRILLRHPRLEKPALLRRSADNGSCGWIWRTCFRCFPATAVTRCISLSWPALKQQGVELLFLATPHEASRSLVPEALAQGLRVIDLSGAWRLKQEQHRAIYNFQDSDAVTAAELTEKAVYGLPELNGDRVANAALVANPGCYATSVILALAPLLKAGVVDRSRGIVSDSKSGVSGAGKEPTAKTHFVSVADNLSAYSVFNHRHVGEIVEQLGLEHAGIDFHAAPAADSARDFVDDLFASEPAR